MRPGFPIRLIIAALITIIVAAVVVAVLMATDTMLSIWQRLNELAPWASALYLVGLVSIALLTGWFAFRLLTGGEKSAAVTTGRLDRNELETRIGQLEADGIEVTATKDELRELDRRKLTQHDAQQQLYLAMFGEISSGKSSLINALLPNAHQATGIVGGTTSQIHYFDWQPADGVPIRLVDLPGFGQAASTRSDPAALTETARDEALRAHVVIYVCDGDLNRLQHAQLAALAALQKPLLLALNKADQFDPIELAQIESRLLDSIDSAALAIVPVQSGGEETVTVIDADGRESSQPRPRPPQVELLAKQITAIVTSQRGELEHKQQIGSLAIAAARLAEAEQSYRRQAAETLVGKFSRRAVIGALAALTPGSDLVIQGALATRFMHELCGLYGVSVRDVDLDQFLTLAGSKLKRTTALTLAVAGNGLKAFPGIGTVAGGLTHAVAYGMIFDSLGRSVAAALEQQDEFKPATMADRFEEQLVGNMETRAGHFVRLALAQLKQKD